MDNRLLLLPNELHDIISSYYTHQQLNWDVSCEKLPDATHNFSLKIWCKGPLEFEGHFFKKCLQSDRETISKLLNSAHPLSFVIRDKTCYRTLRISEDVVGIYTNKLPCCDHPRPYVFVNKDHLQFQDLRTDIINTLREL